MRYYVHFEPKIIEADDYDDADVKAESLADELGLEVDKIVKINW